MKTAHLVAALLLAAGALQSQAMETTTTSSGLVYHSVKDGDGPRFALHAYTTDKVLLFGANGRFYTLAGSNLPSGRGMGEPVQFHAPSPPDPDMLPLIEGVETSSDLRSSRKLTSSEKPCSTTARTAAVIMPLPQKGSPSQ